MLQASGVEAGTAGTTSSGRAAAAGHRLDVLLRTAMHRHRARPALVADGTTLTHGELLDRAERLAADLRARGARPGGYVAVVVDRSAAAVVGVLGTVLSGAAYVPIDPAAPVSRTARIVEAAAASLVTGACSARADGGLGGLERVPPPPAPPPRSLSSSPSSPPVPTGGPAPTDPAYAIFTSGSTGVPKGVVVPHRAIVGSTTARFAVFPSAPMTYLTLAPLTFNAAAAGLYFGLAAGGTVVLPTDDEVRDPGLVAELVTEHGVTHLDAVPSQYAAILEFGSSALGELACVVVAGEPLPQALVRRHAAALPQVPLFNEYGTTETTVWTTVHRCAPDDPGPHAPIGRPVDGVGVRLLDEHLAPVPTGDVGQIAVSGGQLADGYLDRPEETAARFVPDPGPRGGRLFLTGDLGRIDAAGRLVHCGRIGSMVKVRGYRVELAEVEGRLREQPGVLDAVVVPERFGDTTRLVAVVVPTPSGTGSTDLRRALAADLPGYMIPTRWHELRRMPLTSNGKIDRRAVAAQAGVTPDLPVTAR